MADIGQTQIPAPRVPFLDPRTDTISREWFRYFQELAARVRISESLSQIFLSGLVEVSTDYSPANHDTHLVCAGDITITLQTPADRTSELVVTNAGTGIISFVGTIIGRIDMQIGCQWTSIRLRPTLTEWVVV